MTCCYSETVLVNSALVKRSDCNSETQFLPLIINCIHTCIYACTYVRMFSKLLMFSTEYEHGTILYIQDPAEAIAY